jgi:hypothetical protein
MPDNFHDADCALRHSGKVCTCGYQKPLTRQEKELARLVDALAASETTIATKIAVIEELRGALDLAIDLAAEGISYTEPYFVKKWEMDTRLAELKKFATVTSPEPKHG